MKGPFGSFPFMVVKVVKERYSTTLCKFIIGLNKVTTIGVRNRSLRSTGSKDWIFRSSGY